MKKMTNKIHFIVGKGKEGGKRFDNELRPWATAQLANSPDRGHQSAFTGCLLRVRQCSKYPGWHTVQGENTATNNVD